MQGVKKGCECDMCRQGGGGPGPGTGGGGGKQRHSSGGSNHGETLLQYSSEAGVILSSMMNFSKSRIDDEEQYISNISGRVLLANGRPV